MKPPGRVAGGVRSRLETAALDTETKETETRDRKVLACEALMMTITSPRGTTAQENEWC